MSIAGHNAFEVLPAPGGRFVVFVDNVAIAEHSCPDRAAAHCERLMLQAHRYEAPERGAGE